MRSHNGYNHHLLLPSLLISLATFAAAAQAASADIMNPGTNITDGETLVFVNGDVHAWVLRARCADKDIPRDLVHGDQL
jgi:hypothetical protein